MKGSGKASRKLLSIHILFSGLPVIAVAGVPGGQYSVCENLSSAIATFNTALSEGAVEVLKS